MTAVDSGAAVTSAAAHHRSRVPGERASASEEPGPRGDTTGRFNCPSILPCSSWVPDLRSGFAVARPGHESGAREVAARAANRWPWSYSRCQTACVSSFPRRVAAPRFVVFLAFAFRFRRRAHGGFSAGGRRDSSNSVPPMRGGWSADSLTLNFGRACDARPPIPGRPGITLGAPPWRFSDADPRSRLPAVEPEPAATSRARPYDWRSGSGPPCGAVRAASAGRHSWLRLAGSFLENAPSEPGCKSIYYKLST